MIERHYRVSLKEDGLRSMLGASAILATQAHTTTVYSMAIQTLNKCLLDSDTVLFFLHPREEIQ